MREGKICRSPHSAHGNRWRTRAAAWALAVAFLLPLVNQAFVYAADLPEGGLCVHHPAHDEACGYKAVQEAAPCTHVHDETCGYAEAQEGAPCTHVHGEACGYQEAQPEIPCDQNCGADAVVTHQEDCSFAPAAEESPCVHVHDEACGYAEETDSAPAAPCTHIHGET